MSMSHSDYLAQRHFIGLDGLRCMAILAVVWHHSTAIGTLPMLGRGFLGVDLFFVLSGFLITTLLIREKALTGSINLLNFWARRVLRLLPAYYVLLFAMLAAYLLIKPDDPGTAQLVDALPYHALYLSNWVKADAPNLGHTWSLATEEQFYLLWPLVEAFASSVLASAIWLVALIVNQLMNFGLLDTVFSESFGAHVVRREIFDCTFTPILLGVGLAHTLATASGFAKIQRFVGFSGATLAISVALVAALNVPTDDISGLPRLVIQMLFCILLAAILLAPNGSAAQALHARPVAYIGMISYGIYLYHLICIHAARAVIAKLAAPEFLTFALSLGLTIIAATVSYFLLERPFLRMRDRFRSRSASSITHAPV